MCPLSKGSYGTTAIPEIVGIARFFKTRFLKFFRFFFQLATPI
jgi:hypothetical protein